MEEITILAAALAEGDEEVEIVRVAKGVKEDEEDDGDGPAMFSGEFTRNGLKVVMELRRRYCTSPLARN